MNNLPTQACLLSELLQQAYAEHAAHTALRDANGSLTYRELAQEAALLARGLQAHGVRPGHIVGLALPRSNAQIVALCALAACGAAWLPLDLHYPHERLAWMLQDAQASAVLCQGDTPDWLPSLCGNSPLLCLNTLRADAALAAAPQLPRSSENPAWLDLPAYLIYTSGSSGKPKGVLLGQRGLANLAQAQSAAFDLKPGARVLQFASFSFDAACAEILSALHAGAELVLLPQKAVLPGAPLQESVARYGITHLTLPPSVLAEMPEQSLPAGLRLVSAGEACPDWLLQRWGWRLHMQNAYGPTEVTVCASISARLQPGQAITLGAPLPGVSWYVLDENMQEVGSNAEGELYLAGPGLALGYLNRPDLSAERFLPNPFGAPDSRMYKSGDLVWRAPDGSLLYRGRADSLLKIRGFRIDAGEIENLLAPHLAQVAVCARADAHGQQQLLACLVPRPGEKPDLTALKALLAQHLPDYMQPAHWLQLDALPLTPNGKLDLSALPGLSALAAPITSETAPTEEAESSLCAELRQMFAHTLSISAPAADANFFELGGNSLNATRLLHQIRKRFGHSLELDDVLDAPSPQELAELIANLPAAAAPAQKAHLH